jgi:peptidoglycan hydrolase-like protein with peptidoglycan-binding domain
MSRFPWAWTEACALVYRAVRGAGKRTRRGRHGCGHRSWIVGALKPSFIRPALVLATGALVVGAMPATALAHSGHAAHSKFSNRTSHKAPGGSHLVAYSPRSRADGRSIRVLLGRHLLLAPGAGYDSASGSAAVRALQLRLARAGDRPGPIDGRYGPLTQQAVRRFQAAHGLVIDGIAGPVTLAALTSPTPVLYPGAGYGQDRGSRSVRTLQRTLGGLGFGAGPVDGRYGPLTQQAVRRFQAANGLQVDGIASPRTLARLSLKGSSRRQLHRPGTRRSRPTATPRRSRPRHPRPTAAHPRPTPTPAPANAHHARHSAGWSSTTWLILLAGTLLALLALLASVSQYARRRRSASPSTEDLTDGTVTAFSLDRGANELLDAERAFRRADQRGDPNGAFNLGVALEQRGDLAGAVAAYRRADQRGHGAAACNLGVLLEEQGELADAERAFRRADQRGDPNGAFNLGVLLEQSGNLADALTAFRRAGERGSREVGEQANAALLELARDSDGPAADENGGGHNGR